ncbi:MAG: hypothetical protein ACR2LJ_13125 [Acidimicrobiales bacterium]
MSGVRRALGVCATGLFLAGVMSASALGNSRPPGEPRGLAQVQAAPVVPSDARGPSTSVAPSADAVTTGIVGPVPLPLSGCPPPPRPPGSGSPGSIWHPSVLVPDPDLPAPPAPTALVADMAPLRGKGMWVWKFRQSEGGDADAIVARAVAAGLTQLWVRIGDSKDGFYGSDELAALVPRAHARGLSVIGWGFPYLWDPVGDAAWTAEALSWRGPDGASLDGFSPDIEESTEGVMLSEARARLYLGLVRQAAGRRLVVATVYRPTDVHWARYPYEAMAPYVDAFAPMVYWGCTEPGEAATQAIDRLAAMRPVHLIGQGYDMADEGGRSGPPNGAETARFLDVARRGGAVGASFWVWQSIGDEQWATIAGYPWPPPPAHR